MIIDCLPINMHLPCNMHGELFYRTCLQGLYCALRCYVASYIILVYDVVCCRYVLPWWCVKFYTTMVHEVVLDSWICSVKNISFLYVILDLGSFFQDPKIRSVWPSSVVRWSGRRPSIAVDIPRGRREHVPRGRSYFFVLRASNDFYTVRGFVVRTPCHATRSFFRAGV